MLQLYIKKMSGKFRGPVNYKNLYDSLDSFDGTDEIATIAPHSKIVLYLLSVIFNINPSKKM